MTTHVLPQELEIYLQDRAKTPFSVELGVELLNALKDNWAAWYRLVELLPVKNIANRYFAFCYRMAGGDADVDPGAASRKYPKDAQRDMAAMCRMDSVSNRLLRVYANDPSPTHRDILEECSSLPMFSPDEQRVLCDAAKLKEALDAS